jgi:hypothetical protein
MHQSWHEVDIFSDAYKIDWWLGFITLDDQLGLSNIYIYIKKIGFQQHKLPLNLVFLIFAFKRHF